MSSIAEPPVQRHRSNETPFTITRWRPALGATISGLHYTGGLLPPETRSALQQTLYEHGLLHFEPGFVAGHNFTDFLANFGDVALYSGPKTPAATENAQANVVNSSDKRFARNFLWHIDQAFRPDPPALTALFGLTVPSFGGDTLFSNAALAYERLDPHFAAYLETLTVVHYWDATGHLTERFTDPDEASRQRARFPPIETPIVRVHPHTGRKQIFVNESYTTYIKNVSRTTSQSLLTILFESIKSPEVEARYQWQEGALVIWDNRTLQHRGIGDFENQKRVFLRACVA